MMRKLLAGLLIVGLVGGSGVALADPSLTDIRPHRHYVQTPNGELVQVGPRVCDDASLQDAFNQFHNNVHAVSSTGIGPAAPGLHNSRGAEIKFGPC